MLIEIKKRLVGRKGVVEEEELMLSEVNQEGETWKVEAVYVRNNMEKVLKKIRREVDEKKRMDNKR